MHKLLIVDDDEIIREGIEKNIRWEENGFQIVASARNGLEGLELVESCKPHIVLSDIRMPFMNGLQMVEKISKSFPDIKIVLLTGYDDFEYAKKALSMKVTQYVLKYEDNEEILSAVLKARDEFEVERKAREKAKKSTSLLKNRFFGDLLLGIASSELSENEALLLDIPFKSNIFCVAAIHVNDYTMFSKNEGYTTTELITFSVQNICEEIFEKQEPDIFCILYNQRINILINLTEDIQDVKEYLLTLLTEVKDMIKKFLKIDVAIGVGGVYEGFKNISTSYNEALMVVEMKDILGKTGVLFSDNIKNNENSHQMQLKRITEYINNNFYREELSLDDIAEQVHISSNYLSTLFKKYKEVNISEYLVSIRLKKAMDLLANTDLKVYEVSEKVGYSNSQYFSVLFKKTTGYSPIEYRQENKDKGYQK